jgi:hypothetical protein
MSNANPKGITADDCPRPGPAGAARQPYPSALTTGFHEIVARAHGPRDPHTGPPWRAGRVCGAMQTKGAERSEASPPSHPLGTILRRTCSFLIGIGLCLGVVATGIAWFRTESRSPVYLLLLLGSGATALLISARDRVRPKEPLRENALPAAMAVMAFGVWLFFAWVALDP